MAYTPVSQRTSAPRKAGYIPVEERAQATPQLKELMPYTIGGTAQNVDEPKSVVARVAKQAPSVIAEGLQKWTKSEQERVQKQSLTEQAKTTLVKRPAKILGMLAGGLSEIGKTFMELGGTYTRAALTDETIGEANLKMRQSLYGKEKQKEFEKKLFGFEARSYSDWQPGIAKFLEENNALPIEKKILPTLLPIIALSADLAPGGQPAKVGVRKAFENIAKETTEVAIRRSLRELAIPDEIATRVLPELIEANNVNKVKAILRNNISRETNVLTRELAQELEATPTRGVDEVPEGALVKTMDEAPKGTIARTVEKMPTEIAPKVPVGAIDGVTQPVSREARELMRTAEEMKRVGKTFEEFVEETKATGVYKDTPKTKKLFTEVKKDVERITNLPRVLDGVLKESKKGDDILGKLQQQVDVFNKKYGTNYQAADLLRGGTSEREILNTATQNAYIKSDIGWDYTPLKTGVWDRVLTTSTPARGRAPRLDSKLTRTQGGTTNKQTARTKSVSSVEPTSAPKDGEVNQMDRSYEKDIDNKLTINDGEKDVKLNIGAPEDKVRATPEEMDNIIRLSKADGIRFNAPTPPGTIIRPRDLVADMRMRIEKSSAKIPDEEIARMRNEMLLEPEVLSDAIVRKRGVRTIQEMTNAAKMSRETTDNLIALQRGATVSGEGMKVAASLVQYERELLKDLKALVNGGGIAQTPSERETLRRLGYEGKAEITILNDALAEQTVRTIKAELAYIGLRSEAGRSLRATREFVESVDVRLRTILSHAKRMDEDARTALIERLSRLDLSDNKTFLKELESMNNADWWDKAAEYATAVKLWNPTTHVVNVGGNMIRQGSDLVIKTVANPTVAMADWKGASVGIQQGLKNALRALTDEGFAQTLSKHIELGGQAPAIKGKLGKTVRYPFQLLAAGDELFRAIGFNRSMYRQAFIRARKEGHKGLALNNRMKDLLERPSLEMTDGATEQAKRLTFQEDMGEIVAILNGLRTPAQRKSWYGKLFSLMFRAFVPFLKTPTNLFKQSLDFSPIGLLKNNKVLREAVKKGDKETVGTIIGEAVLGTALMYYFWEKHQEGKITGGAPKDKSKKDKFFRENKIPYAIKIGDTWVQYKRVDPFATMLGLVADISTLKREGEDFGLGSVAYMLSQQLADKTYLQGVNDLMNLLGAGEDWEAEYAWKSAILGGTLPSIIGHTARSMDPNVRVADTIPERFMAITPGMSDKLPTKINVLGYDVKRANKGLNYFFNPIQTERAYIEPVTRELMNINKVIPVPSKYFVREGVRYDLTPEEYETYARETGQELHSELDKLFATNKYKNATLDKKEDMIDTLRKRIQTKYKDEYLKTMAGEESPATNTTTGNMFDDAFSKGSVD